MDEAARASIKEFHRIWLRISTSLCTPLVGRQSCRKNGSRSNLPRARKTAGDEGTRLSAPLGVVNHDGITRSTMTRTQRVVVLVQNNTALQLLATRCGSEKEAIFMTGAGCGTTT